MDRCYFFPTFSLFFVGLLSLASAHASAPAAPSGLKVTPLGVNAFLVEWKDNSTDEVGFELRIGLKSKKAPPRFSLIPTLTLPDADSDPTTETKSRLIITNNLSGKELDFQVTAYNGATGQEIFSNPTEVVTIRALSPTSFRAPTNLTVKYLDDGQVRLGWKDNSTTEFGYQIERKKGTGKWAVLGTIQAGLKFNIPISDLEQSSTYSFRVRAYRENPVAFTAYSNVLTITSKPFQAPSDLVATVEPDGAFSFAWKDNSSLEYGYEIQSQSGTGEFISLGEVGADVITVPTVPNFECDKVHQFRVRGFREVNLAKVYSDFSATISVKSSALAKPANLAALSASDTSVDLTWQDVSTREFGYLIQRRAAGASEYDDVASVGANGIAASASDLEAGTSYEFRIRAHDGNSYSAYTEPVSVRTKDGVIGNLSPPISVGSEFDYTVEVSDFTTLASLTVTGLPVGLTYHAETRKITGSTTVTGTVNVTITAIFNDGHTSVRTLALQIRSAPAEAAPAIMAAFAPVNVLVSQDAHVSISGKFTDPDTASAARFVTSLGTFDIILFSNATPLTVDNFLDYIDAGEYDNTFFHRSPPNFVVQGGGYKYTPATGFTKVTKLPAVLNEPGISNVKGTVAMAKLGGQPNSATCEFFVNAADNSSNLDVQNGGFTVFGRVPDAGMTVLSNINALPVGKYNVAFGSESLSLTDVPIDDAAAPLTLDPAKLVKVISVGPAPILVYQIASADPGIATASLTGEDITITGVATGSTVIEVTATDLDGKAVTQNIAVTVP